MNKVDKAVAAALILGAILVIGTFVPVATTHQQNVRVCQLGGTCQPCSIQQSLFSMFIGFPPISNGCLHPETSGAQTGETIFIQVVNASTMAPIAGMSVYAGPTPSPNDVFNTPGGPTLVQCGQVVPNGASVGDGKVVSNGTTTTLTFSCPLVEYTTDASGRVSISNATGPFYYVKTGNFNIGGWNDIVVGVEANTVVNMTIPLPSGEITTPWSSGGTRQALPFLWPNTSIVWPCGEALPNDSTATSQGVYAGQYIAYSYAALPNGTAAAIAEDCPVGLFW